MAALQQPLGVQAVQHVGGGDVELVTVAVDGQAAKPQRRDYRTVLGVDVDLFDHLIVMG